MAERNLESVELPVLAWAGWDQDGGTLRHGGDVRPATAVPASLRRRVTPAGRRALEAAWAVLGGRDDAAPRIVLSSRHGEYDRTAGLLRAQAEGDEPSPAEFSLAVHHGLAGLLSIATGNRAGHTAVAAGADTLGAALTEAAACLADGDPMVLLLHFDDALPPEYAAFADGRDMRGAFALLLGTGGAGFRLDWRPAGSETAPRQAASAAADLFALLRGETGTMAFPGERKSWRLSRAA